MSEHPAAANLRKLFRTACSVYRFENASTVGWPDILMIHRVTGTHLWLEAKELEKRRTQFNHTRERWNTAWKMDNLRVRQGARLRELSDQGCHTFFYVRAHYHWFAIRFSLENKLALQGGVDEQWLRDRDEIPQLKARLAPRSSNPDPTVGVARL